MAWRKANSLVGSIGRIRSAAASSPIAAAARSAPSPETWPTELTQKGSPITAADRAASCPAAVSGPLSPGLARQRVQVERVAAAGPVDGAAPRPAAAPAEHRLGLGLAQRAEPQTGRRAVTPGR